MRVDLSALDPKSPLAAKIAAAIRRDEAEREARQGPAPGMPFPATETAARAGRAPRSARTSQNSEKRASDQIWSPGVRSPEGWAREEDLHRAVWAMIAAEVRSDVVIFHPANGGARSKAEAGRMKAQGVVPGVPDLIVIAGGKVYGLELKTERGRVSPAQRQMAELFRSAGSAIEVARSVFGARSILARWDCLA